MYIEGENERNHQERATSQQYSETQGSTTTTKKGGPLERTRFLLTKKKIIRSKEVKKYMNEVFT
jgi:hypothetical protein